MFERPYTNREDLRKDLKKSDKELSTFALLLPEIIIAVGTIIALIVY